MHLRWLPGALAALLVAAPAVAQVGSPAGPVPVPLLAQRRALLLDRIGDGVVVLRSGRVQDTEGVDYPQASDFRQDNDFFYLTGLEVADAWLVLRAHSSSADQVTLYIPPRDSEQEQWTGPGLDAREAGTISGIADVRTGGPDAAAATIAPRAVHEQIAALRLVKDEDELRRLRRAADITCNALISAMQKARPGAWEYQIEADIEYAFHWSGAERVGFPTIVGSGPNSAVLHYDKSRRQTMPGDLVVMDVGAEFGYYTADVTRTMPVSGTFTPRQRALYDLVLGTQQAVIDSIRPGMSLPRMEEIARDYMQRHSGTLCGSRTCDEYFIHAIGHWLGMDVHDPGPMEAVFAPGMVVTVEPGVYLSSEGLGIRIEDDVLVTSTGHEVLSAKAPRSAEDVEKLMRAGQGK